MMPSPRCNPRRPFLYCTADTVFFMEGGMRATARLMVSVMLVAGAANRAMAAPDQAASVTQSATETIGASLNNAGLQNELELAWRRPLTQSSAPIRSDAHASVGVTHTLSPSYTRVYPLVVARGSGAGV